MELLSLSKQDLIRMKIEFGECYDDMFTKSFQSLQKIMNVKVFAMESCAKTLEKEIKNNPSGKINVKYSLEIF